MKFSGSQSPCRWHGGVAGPAEELPHGGLPGERLNLAGMDLQEVRKCEEIRPPSPPGNARPRNVERPDPAGVRVWPWRKGRHARSSLLKKICERTSATTDDWKVGGGDPGAKDAYAGQLAPVHLQPQVRNLSRYRERLFVQDSFDKFAGGQRRHVPS